MTADVQKEIGFAAYCAVHEINGEAAFHLAGRIATELNDLFRRLNGTKIEIQGPDGKVIVRNNRQYPFCGSPSVARLGENAEPAVAAA